MPGKGIQMDYTGARFNRLVVVRCLGKIRTNSRQYMWLSMCDCGKEVVCCAYDLKKGHTKSCGCLRDEARTKHGLSKTREYQQQRSRQHEFGISPERYEEILKEQGNKCLLCCTEFIDTPTVDHDHACCGNRRTGERKTCGKCVRGLLCRQCNAGLGSFRDNIRTLLNAVEYLRRFRNDRSRGTGSVARSVGATCT